MKIIFFFVLSILATLTSFDASSSVVVGGTRVVFDGSKKETSLSVENRDTIANLVQSWITPVDATTPAKEAMIITPPLFRLNAGEKNVLRIVRSGLPMPDTHESMYWLNVKGIAATTDELSGSSMQIAINSRIKLIYRPAALKGISPEQVTDKMTWQVSSGQLQVNNPTPYYMNFAIVTIGSREVTGATWVAPLSTAEFPLPHGEQSGKVSWRIYNDFGMAGAEHQYSP